MVQNIHPFGIKTRFVCFPLVWRLMVRPSWRVALVPKGRDSSKPFFSFFEISFVIAFIDDMAGKKGSENLHLGSLNKSRSRRNHGSPDKDTDKISISSRRDSYGNRLIIDQRGNFLKKLWCCIGGSHWRRANARNVSLWTLYGGQFTFSTQLIILNYPDCWSAKELRLSAPRTY